MRNILIFLLLCLALLPLSGCAPPVCEDPLGCVRVDAGQPVRVGLLLPLTGPEQASGSEQRAAAGRVALEFGPLSGHLVETFTLDLDCPGGGEVRAATSLAAEPGLIGVIGRTCTQDGPAFKIMSDAGMPFIPLRDGSSRAAESAMRGLLQTAADAVKSSLGGQLLFPLSDLLYAPGTR